MSSPGMAAQDASDGEVEAFDGTMLLQGFDGILRTGRREAARRRCHRRDESLIETNGEDEQTGEQGSGKIEILKY